MMYKEKWITGLLFLFFFFFAFSGFSRQKLPETIRIRIFTDQYIRSLKIIPSQGKYLVSGPAGVIVSQLELYENINFTIEGEFLKIISGNRVFYSPFPVHVEGNGFDNAFVVRPDGYPGRSRIYDGSLIIDYRDDQLLLIAQLSLESYIAGVVQSESGMPRHPEFYKVQAIIARTFAASNINRHTKEGYNLCDQVHCQAYYGKSRYQPVMEAVWQTSAQVVTDMNNNLIEAVYHANCGGQTMNSEEVWSQALPYLRSVSDPYCVDKPGANWRKSIHKDDFQNFLKDHYSDDSEARHDIFPENFIQNSRKAFFDEGNLLNLGLIRSRFNLRSTFFSISSEDDMINFEGKGYGHGVGLCQEGAMTMAEKGFTADSIISYYYKDVKIISLYNMFVNWSK